MKELIICEKPKQAKEFATIFSKYSGKELTFGKGYYSNGSITVTYAIGHLVGLANPVDYDKKYQNWDKLDLPIIPKPFKYRLLDKTKSQFNVIKKLYEEHDVIINATDPEREGELIFRYIVNAIGNDNSKAHKRLWANNYQYQTIINSYKDAKDLKAYDNLYYSAKARSEIDWLIGINSTRMLTLNSNSEFVLSLGRVQTAILRLIVDRYNDHTDFNSQPTYKPSLKIGDLNLDYNKTYLKEDEAVHVKNNTQSPVELLKEVKEKSNKQPKLFSLLDLQVLMSSKHNIDSSKTLEITQSLYENKLVSYPRTDASFLPKSMKEEVHDTLSKLKDFIPNMLFESYNIPNDNYVDTNALNNHYIFNDAKTSDHYALIPLSTQQSDISKLSEQHLLVYKEIVKRFLRCFMKPAILNETSYRVPCKIHDAHYYQKKGFEIKFKGHLILEDKQDNILPNIDPGKHTEFDIHIQKGKTQPKPIFTEPTLLKAMKNPLGLDENAKSENENNLKDIGLGTPATNDKYLPLLIQRQYVSIVKKNIIPTKLGIAVINALKETRIASVLLTVKIENKLYEIRNGDASYSEFMGKMINYTTNLIGQIHAKANADYFGSLVKKEITEFKCPKCETGKMRYAKDKSFIYCNNYRSETPCKTTLKSSFCGAKFTDNDINNLLSGKTTRTLNMTSKAKTKFKAKIKLKENMDFDLIFENSKNSKKKTAKK